MSDSILLYGYLLGGLLGIGLFAAQHKRPWRGMGRWATSLPAILVIVVACNATWNIFTANAAPALALVAQTLPDARQPASAAHSADVPWAVPYALEAAPGYCESSGGDGTYEFIKNIELEPQPDGTQKLSVQIYIANPEGCSVGSPCESYDPYPENVNVWIDWNGDKVWDENERVLDKSLTGYLGINYAGTMSAVSQVVVPPNAVGVTWLRANVGWKSDPNDPCAASWEWGHVYDREVVASPPKIKEIVMTGSVSPDNPTTTQPVIAEVVLDISPGYEIVKVTWTGDIAPGEGNPYAYIPEAGTHGNQRIKAIVTYLHTASGVQGTVSKEHDFKLFFEKKGDENGNGAPNWFEYWRMDGAVPSLNASDILYSATDSNYGSWNPNTSQITLGSAAADVHYPGKFVVPAIANQCPGGVFGGVFGIDSVAEVVAHERQHEVYGENWLPGGPWQVGVTLDSDDPTPNNKTDMPSDRLPDEYEKTVTGTSPTLIDSCNLATLKNPSYVNNGDNEFAAILAGHGKVGVADKDWAFPGKQSNPPYAGGTTVASASADLSGDLSSDEANSVSAATSAYATPVVVDAPTGVVMPNLAQLSGSYSDVGVDSNGDNLFDQLRFTVGVNVQAAGEYNVVAWLRDSANVDFAFARRTVQLAAGNQQVTLDFDGKLINRHGKNGPYTLAHIELNIGDHDDLVQFEQNVHTTTAYVAANFVPPSVTLTGNFSSATQDSNGNALFDQLNVSTNVQVNTPGSYIMVGWLVDKDGTPIPNGAASASFSASGNVTLRFDGRAIRWQRAQGPYSVRNIDVRDGNGERVLFVANAHTTATYNANQFEGSNTGIVTNSYSDVGVDVNGDGKFDYLKVDLRLNVSQAGNYQLLATLRADARGQIVNLALPLTLAAGSNQAVALQFPGGDILSYAANGPYQVASVTLLNAQGSIVDYQAVGHVTQAYQAADFGQPLVALTNNIRDFATDSNGDGKYESLDIAIDVRPGNFGYVVVQGRLMDKNGKEIAWAEKNAQIEADIVEQVVLSFPADKIAANGVDGPFTLRNLLIYHTGDPDQALVYEEAHTTAAYYHLTLDRPLVMLYAPAVVNAVKAACVPDVQRETTNVGNAQIICPGQTVSASVDEVSDQEDVYRIWLPANQPVRITLTSTGDDADLYLYAPNTKDITGAGDDFFARSTRTKEDELIEATTDVAGYWFVNVYGFSGYTNYQLRVEVMNAATASVHEAAEHVIGKNK